MVPFQIITCRLNIHTYFCYIYSLNIQQKVFKLGIFHLLIKTKLRFNYHEYYQKIKKKFFLTEPSLNLQTTLKIHFGKKNFTVCHYIYLFITIISAKYMAGVKHTMIGTLRIVLTMATTQLLPHKLNRKGPTTICFTSLLRKQFFFYL